MKRYRLINRATGKVILTDKLEEFFDIPVVRVTITTDSKKDIIYEGDYVPHLPMSSIYDLIRGNWCIQKEFENRYVDLFDNEDGEECGL